MMTAIFSLLAVQGVLGALDNLIHHEMAAKLPKTLASRVETLLHACREAIYAAVFFGLAWFEFRGVFGMLLLTLLAVEVAITLTDFLEEDRTRTLPPFERLLHAILTLTYGILLGLLFPLLLDWITQPTALPVTSHGLWSWLLTVYAVGVGAWSIRNFIACAGMFAKARTAPAMLPLRNGKTLLITGGTGFVGSALTRSLLDEGYRLYILTRDVRQARANPLVRAAEGRIVPIDRLNLLPDETALDAIVNLAGAPIAGIPWTPQRRAVLMESRLGTTRSLVDLCHRLKVKPSALISASAVGYYGPSGSLATEDTPADGSFQSSLCQAWEAEAVRAEELGLRVCRVRFGLILGRSGGIFPALKLSAKLGFGAVLGTGKQAFPWISLTDAVDLLIAAVNDPRMTGPINAVSPDILSQSAFAHALSHSLERKVRLKVPAFALTSAMGEMSQLLVDGRAVKPAKLLALNHPFTHRTLAAFLEDADEESSTEFRKSAASSRREITPRRSRSPSTHLRSPQE